jgi:hypothetical protein
MQQLIMTVLTAPELLSIAQRAKAAYTRHPINLFER